MLSNDESHTENKSCGGKKKKPNNNNQPLLEDKGVTFFTTSPVYSLTRNNKSVTYTTGSQITLSTMNHYAAAVAGL